MQTEDYSLERIARLLRVLKVPIHDGLLSRNMIATSLKNSQKTVDRWYADLGRKNTLPNIAADERPAIVEALEKHAAKFGLCDEPNFEDELKSQFHVDAKLSWLYRTRIDLANETHELLDESLKLLTACHLRGDAKKWGVDRSLNEVETGREECFRDSGEYFHRDELFSSFASAEKFGAIFDLARNCADFFRDKRVIVEIAGTSPLCIFAINFIIRWFDLQDRIIPKFSSLTTKATREIDPAIDVDFIFAGCVTWMINSTEYTRNFKLGAPIYGIKQDTALSNESWDPKDNIELAYIKQSTGFIRALRFAEKYDADVELKPYKNSADLHRFIVTPNSSQFAVSMWDPALSRYRYKGYLVKKDIIGSAPMLGCFANQSLKQKWDMEPGEDGFPKHESCFYNLLWFAFCYLLKPGSNYSEFNRIYDDPLLLHAVQSAMGTQINYGNERAF